MGNLPTLTRTTGAFYPTPPNTRFLWHLMCKEGEKNLETFLRGGLWFARLDTFRDSLEGALPGANLGLLNKLPKSQVPVIEREYVLGVERSFASCWHMSDDDPSPEAWSIFGGAGNGIAIRTTPQLFTNALALISGPDGPVHGPGAIRYIDHSADVIPEANVIEAVFVVRADYHEEREARVLIHTHGTAAADHLCGKKGLFGDLVRPVSPAASKSGRHEFIGGHENGLAIVVKVDPVALIQEIVLGPRVPGPARKRILGMVAHYRLAGRLRP